jgi:hypothetical protein
MIDPAADQEADDVEPGEGEKSSRLGTPLLEVGFAQCRYIVSQSLSPAICCGAPTNGGSWCDEHKARVFVRLSEGKRPAPFIPFKF